MRTDVLDVLDAAYAVDLPEETWLEGLVDVARQYLTEGEEMLGYTFDLAGAGGARITCIAGRETPVPMDLTVAAAHRLAAEAPDVLWALHLRGAAGTTLSDACARIRRLDLYEALASEMRPYGESDAFFLNGADPSGRGCTLSFSVRRWEQLDRRVKRRWGRVAAHLASAHRLRCRVGASEPTRGPDPTLVEAVLAPDGTLAHAEGEARARAARDALSRAVRGFDRAHTRAGRSDADFALDEWKGLVAARWTLVEQLESDGKRYLIARQNDHGVVGLASLSVRERQVTALLAMGHANKSIAYELGLAVSTVGVLLGRAAKKLGAQSRRELVARFEQAVAESEGPA